MEKRAERILRKRCMGGQIIEFVKQLVTIKSK